MNTFKFASAQPLRAWSVVGARHRGAGLDTVECIAFGKSADSAWAFFEKFINPRLDGSSWDRNDVSITEIIQQ